MLKIGVLGTGHLGKIHLNCLQNLADKYTLSGFYDPDRDTAATVARDYQIPLFQSEEELIDAVDVVDIVTPTSLHATLAEQAILAGKHTFIEKPVTEDLSGARKIRDLAYAHGVKVQIGHVERFNPAFLALQSYELNPMFIEGHRLSTFNPRGTDVSVVLDLMIHDLDLIAHLVNANVESVHANGVAIVSRTPDICNARIEFENGCVANLTASRISMKNMRKLRLFQGNAYISMDFLDKESQIIRLYDAPPEAENTNAMHFELDGKDRWLHMENLTHEPVNAIQMELESFARAIHHDQTPVVTIEMAIRSLELAQKVIHAIEETTERQFGG